MKGDLAESQTAGACWAHGHGAGTVPVPARETERSAPDGTGETHACRALPGHRHRHGGPSSSLVRHRPPVNATPRTRAFFPWHPIPWYGPAAASGDFAGPVRRARERRPRRVNDRLAPRLQPLLRIRVMTTRGEAART